MKTRSSTQPIKYEIPQGSILGPLSFIMYTNDMCNVFNMVLYILYADDATVMRNEKDILNLELENSQFG